MDARVRQLLEPERASQNDVLPPHKLRDPEISPIKYDPRALLNPRSAARSSKHGGKSAAKSRSPYFSSMSLDDHGSRESSRMEGEDGDGKRSLDRDRSAPKSMLEGLYGVERRVDQPRKKVKTEHKEKDLSERSKSTFHNRSNGIVGDYLKPDSDVPASVLPTEIDLTSEHDDDDDEIIITGSRSLDDEEVCYGHVPATVLAYAIPKPGENHKFAATGHWPTIKCTLTRTNAKDNVIDVLDPSGTKFGRIRTELAVVLGPAMDGLRDLRTQIRLLSRRKKDSEWTHQPCSDNMKAVVNIYGRRADVGKIGKLFGQKNIWFRPPMMPDRDSKFINPHSTRNALQLQTQGAGRKGMLSDTRTIEEATEAVSKLFDHSASTATALASTEAPPGIITPLLEHQKQALTFLLEHERPRTYGAEEADNSSLWRVTHKSNGEHIYKEVVSGITLKEEPDQVYGGLLADVMGLGKTLEALCLIAATLEDGKRFAQQNLIRDGEEDKRFKAHTRATLLVSPVSTIKNWEDQVAEHIAPKTVKVCTYHGSSRTQNPFELTQYDIVITTYGTISAEISRESTRKMVSPLRQLKWFRIILDEAHTIREARSAQSQAAYSLWAERRWCLTGTPIQNRIEDLGSLTRFLRLFPYDTPQRFNQYIRGPAQSGDPSFLKALRVFVDSFTLRRLRDRIDLPKRVDLVEILAFSEEERRLHDFFKEISHIRIEELTKHKDPTSGIQHHVLTSIMTLRLICAHGRELLKQKDLQKLEGMTVDEAIDIETEAAVPTLKKKDAFDHLSMMTEAEVDMCRVCDKRLSADQTQVDGDDGQEGVRCFVLPCFDVVCNECFAEEKGTFDALADTEQLSCPFCTNAIAAQYIAVPAADVEDLEAAPTEAAGPSEIAVDHYRGPHTKTKALLRDIKEMNVQSAALIEPGQPPMKCVVFSEFTSHLDLIERALIDEGLTFVRIDGSMSLRKRKNVLDSLNNDDDVTILLASIKAAGQGLNLTAACRAFIMEPMWNPAAEAQAVDRIYRIGQKRDMVIKRYQMANSIELKIVELQKRKQALADVSIERNHEKLSKQELREKHYKDILALFK